MRNGMPIILGAGRVIQDRRALDRCGDECRSLGKKALIVSSKTPWAKFSGRLLASLERNGLQSAFHLFEGYCSDSNTGRIAALIQETGSDFVIVMGGGRCLDAGKWAAEKAGVRCVTVPTSAATCAAYVTLCVMYDDTGSTIGSVFTSHENAAVIIDTEILTRECPDRMLASGIADSLAKFPELDFSMVYATDWEKSVLPRMGLEVAKTTEAIYYEKGLKAITDARNGQATSDLEDVAATNIILTGLISSLASGGKQLAIAHSLYDCVCTLFKAQRAAFLHGEIVACGIQVQMGVNQYPEPLIRKMVQFLKELGMPLKLGEMGIDTTRENMDAISGYILTTMEINDPDIRSRILENLDRLV